MALCLSKEELFFEHLCLPDHKPPLLKLLECQVNPEVIEYKQVDTPYGRSFEGECLTGLSLICLLSLDTQITYIADNQAQTIHAVSYTFLKSFVLNLPEPDDLSNLKQLINMHRFRLIPSISSPHTYIKTPTLFNLSTLIRLEFQTY